MNRIFIMVGLIAFLVSGCRSSTEDAGRIEYEELNKIETEIVMEIGKSDNYLPGRLRDLILASDGTMLVSDLGKTTIEQFSADGEHVSTVATEGKGPGELPSFFSLVDGGSGMLSVQHGSMSRQIDFFKQSMDGIYKYASSMIPKQPAGQRLDLIGPSGESAYFAHTGPSDAAFISTNVPEYRLSPVAVVSRSLTISRDSLHMLKTPNHLFGNPGLYSTGITMNGLAFLGMPPYRYRDHFRLLEDGRYMIARPDSAALFIYNSNHELERHIALHVKARPVQNTDLDYALRSKGEKVRRELEAYVSDIKPPFLDVWISEEHIWLHTDDGEKGKQFVVLNIGGDPKGTFYLSEFDDIRYVRNGRIYTLHKNPEAGHSIRVYRVEL